MAGRDVSDAQLIRQCIRLAKRAVKKGNHPFGALLALDGAILLTAENTVTTDRDWTGHAELNLIKLARLELDAAALSRCSIYSSTEPCSMCAGAIYQAGVPRVVFGCSSEALKGVTGGKADIACKQMFSAASLPIEVVGPILEAESLALHRRFWKNER